MNEDDALFKVLIAGTCPDTGNWGNVRTACPVMNHSPFHVLYTVGLGNEVGTATIAATHSAATPTINTGKPGAVHRWGKWFVPRNFRFDFVTRAC